MYFTRYGQLQSISCNVTYLAELFRDYVLIYSISDIISLSLFIAISVTSHCILVIVFEVVPLSF